MLKAPDRNKSRPVIRVSRIQKYCDVIWKFTNRKALALVFKHILIHFEFIFLSPGNANESFLGKLQSKLIVFSKDEFTELIPASNDVKIADFHFKSVYDFVQNKILGFRFKIASI